MQEIPLWSIFLLETQSYCNLRCPNCQRNTEPTKSRFRGGQPIKEQMPTEKVRDLIDQAAELGYRGIVLFCYYNEPMCDPRLVSFVKYARRKGMLPKVATNGTLLTDALCKQLDGVIDGIVIGVANRKPRDYWLARFRRTRRVSVFINRPGAWSITHFSPQKGRLQAAIRKNINAPCHIPRTRLIIGYDGEMCLCCDDLSHNFDLGNAFEQSIEELWWSEKHVKIIRTLSVAGGRLKYPYCRTCPATGTSRLRIRHSYKKG